MQGVRVQRDTEKEDRVQEDRVQGDRVPCYVKVIFVNKIVSKIFGVSCLKYDNMPEGTQKAILKESHFAAVQCCRCIQHYVKRSMYFSNLAMIWLLAFRSSGKLITYCNVIYHGMIFLYLYTGLI